MARLWVCHPSEVSYGRRSPARACCLAVGKGSGGGQATRPLFLHRLALLAHMVVLGSWAQQPQCTSHFHALASSHRLKASHLAQPRLQGWREGQVLTPEAIKSHCKGKSMEEWEEFETMVVKTLPQFVLLSCREVWGTNRTGSQGPKVEQFE